MQLRDRIVEFRRVPVSMLRPHPRRWRTHPVPQRAALQAILLEVGYANALLVRAIPNEEDAFEIIDGHLRAELSPDQQVPVLILDVDHHDACKLLALVDPLAAQADTDQQQLSALLEEIDWNSSVLEAVATEMLNRSAPTEVDDEDSTSDILAEVFQIVVDCDDEPAQRTLYERLTAENFRCRVVTV